jgi:putative drug exporter of the RND superfamily
MPTIMESEPRHGRVAGWPCGRRSKYLVVAFWLIVVALMGPLASRLQGVESNDPSAYLPASAESVKELHLQTRFTPVNLNPAVVVYTRPSGITPADLSKARADARQFAALPAVHGRVTGPTLSPDHQALETIVGADLGYRSDLSGFINGLNATASAGDPGLAVHITGPAAVANDEVQIVKGIDTKLLFATLAVVIVLLLLSYRGPALWILPIVSAGVALTVSEAIIYLLATHGLTVNSESAGLLVVLVLGAGTDYALLLIARYREELRRHEDRHEAMAVALRRAGPAIMASAATVMAAMVCLFAADSADISGLGQVAAIGIAVALIAMLTLLPAVLVIFGRWIFWPARPRYGAASRTARGLWARTARAIAGRPRLTWVIAAVLLGCAALGMIGFRVGSLTTAQSFRGTPPSVVGEQVLASHFPAGLGEPVAVIGRAAETATLRSALAATPGISGVPPAVTADGLVYLQGTLTSQPASRAAFATVDRVRAALHRIPGAHAEVGGGTAVTMDQESYATRDRNVVIPLVLLVIMIILGLLLRAVVAPVILIGTVILSFAAALGLSALAFRHLFGFAGEDASVPLFTFVFLVALGIDYNIFLMTRIREEAVTSGTKPGAITGLTATGGVITSAGAVLAGTFATLGTLPLVIFTEIGITVAVGVLLDTFIVRSVVVTALTLDIGRWMWWPSPLARHRAGEQAAVRSMPAAPVQ